MINKRFHFLFSTILFLGFAIFFSCKTQEKAAGANSVQELPNALLWEISGHDLEEPSMLFGTIHLIDKDHFFWPDGTLSAIENAEKVVFEIDLDDMFDISAQMGILMKAFMKDGQTLKDFYTDEEYGIVSDHFRAMGIPLFFLERIKPMFLTVFASGEIDISGFQSGGNMKSYEMEIYEIAQNSRKDVDGLETMDYQISIFDSIPYNVQAEMLLESIKSSQADNDQFKLMVELYVSQNITAMAESMEDPEQGLEGYEEILLYQRNRNWIPVMADHMRDGTTFFAVGAGHLGGKDGVIDLLMKAGYTLKPLGQGSPLERSKLEKSIKRI